MKYEFGQIESLINQDDQGRDLLHARPLPPIGPAKPIPAEKPPETQCSECGIGPGADHLKHCRRGRRRYHPMNPKGF